MFKTIKGFFCNDATDVGKIEIFENPPELVEAVQQQQEAVQQQQEAESFTLRWLHKQVRDLEQTVIALKVRRPEVAVYEYVAPEWQPIETAPKTEEPVLVVWGAEVCLARWKADWYGDTTRQGWIEVPLDEEYGELFYPTHWMPLPQVPTK